MPSYVFIRHGVTWDHWSHEHFYSVITYTTVSLLIQPVCNCLWLQIHGHSWKSIDSRIYDAQWFLSYHWLSLYVWVCGLVDSFIVERFRNENLNQSWMSLCDYGQNFTKLIHRSLYIYCTKTKTVPYIFSGNHINSTPSIRSASGDLQSFSWQILPTLIDVHTDMLHFAMCMVLN